ncbi:hypothetical protein ACSBR1_004446 [Camellia fascicularis]
MKGGDLMLKKNRVPLLDQRGKFKPNWLRPYIIKKIMTGRAVVLMDLDGSEFTQSDNLDKK